MKIERQLQGTLNTIFTELIKEKGLEKKIAPYAILEEGHADITLKNSNGKTIFFIELKDPTARDGKSVFDSNTLVREISRAHNLEIQYFAICNFLACAFFDSHKIHEKVSVNEGFFSLADITRLSTSYSPNKDIENKLRKVAGFYLDRAIEIIERKPITFSPLDELFIFKIRKLIEVYAYPISDAVWDKYRKSKQFEKQVQSYTQSQLWNKPSTYEEIENLTHISILMLISKLIFYKAYVDNQTWHNLHPMKIREDIETPTQLEALIWEYFEEFKEITGNFELLIGERADVIFQIPFASDAIIDLVKDILETEGHYDFSNIPFDIIGRIFEELIRQDERHKLGQYFTPPDVIDLINAFTIHKGNDKVFDPSCGSGTFLVRAYERKKSLKREEDKGALHEILLNEIYGNDLSGYPAYLSMLNLAIRNTKRASYPRIANKDFFAVTERTTLAFHNQKGVIEKKALPKFDAIIGNPPYTRQEDIGTMHGTQPKEKIQGLIKAECGFEPSQRTSIYAYFFYHASIFLKDGGYLAFIVQNSWLDTDYGIDLQRYLMRNYEIIAIMDSEVERFFPSASVNTSIVILRKQKDENKRNNNTVKFIYFTSAIAEAIKAFKGVDKLYEKLEEAQTGYIHKNFKVNCIQQEILADHTKWSQFLKAPDVYFDILEKGKNNLRELAGKKGLANIYYGLKSGCNEFFFGNDITQNYSNTLISSIINNANGLSSVSEIKKNELTIFKNGIGECWLIEKNFLKPILKTTREIDKYILDSPTKNSVVFFINLLEKFSKNKKYDIPAYKKYLKDAFPYAFSYIKHGERVKIKNEIVANKPSCASRPAWWDLGGQQNKDFILIQFRDKRNWNPIVTSDIILGNVAFFGKFNTPKNKKILSISLNSTFSILQSEMLGRVNLGDGLLTTYGPDLAQLKIIDDRKIDPKFEKEIDKVYDSLKGLEVQSIFDDLGTDKADEFSIERVKKFRLNMDQLILKILGYSDEKSREIILTKLYIGLIQIVKSRMIKSKSLKSVKVQRGKVEFRVYIEQLMELMMEEKLSAKNTITFARQAEKLVKKITSENKLQKKILDTYWKEKFGELFDERKIADNSQHKLI